MPRGKRIVIDKKIKDGIVEKYMSYNSGRWSRKYNESDASVMTSVSKAYNLAKQLYKTRSDEESIEQTHNLYTVRTAYDYLRSHKIDISFRAFCGRLERGAMPYVKIGRKRFIPQAVLNSIVDKSVDMYTVQEAFAVYKKYNPSINFRAFIGRIEKESIPSVKLGSRRYIPKDAMKAAVHIAKNYHTVRTALKQLESNGIHINRNAFERRLDRRTIPHFKISGRRYIHKTVLQELMDKEKVLRGL